MCFFIRTQNVPCVQAAEFASIFDIGVPGTEELDSSQKDFIFPVTMHVKQRLLDGACLFPVAVLALFLLPQMPLDVMAHTLYSSCEPQCRHPIGSCNFEHHLEPSRGYRKFLAGSFFIFYL